MVRGDFSLINEAIATARGRPRRRGVPAQISGASLTALTDTLMVPAFLVRFSNTDPTTLHPVADYEALLYAPSQPVTVGAYTRPYSVRTFYEEMSNGMFSLQGVVAGWIALANDDAFYAGPCNGLCSSGNVAALIREAVQASDATIDFRQFDNDGPDGAPNSGDDDGEVDLIYLIHPELGAECGGSGNIWAHRFFYTAWTGGVALNTLDTGVSEQPIRIENYTIQSGLGGHPSNGNPCDPNHIMPPGTIAHETGHGIGLPDLYDVDGTDGDNSEGTGEWSLMGSGNYARPLSPAHMDGYLLSLLGWVTVRPATTGGSFTLGSVQRGDTAFVVRPPAGVSNPRGEYFLLENRQAVDSDSAIFAKYGGSGGLLIWHVDSLKYASCLFSNCVNTGAIHGVWLMQADGLNNLRSSVSSSRNRGDAGDPFPGMSGNLTFGVATRPSATLNTSGNPFAGLIVDSIRQMVPNGEMAFRIRFGALTVVRASDTTAQVRVRGTAYRVFRDVLEDGDTATVSIDSLQSGNGGRTQYVFASWSDGLARTHQITGSMSGGALTANVTVQHQVTVTTAGSGTVATTPNVPVAAGAFVTQGAGLTLAATPAADQAFIGWSGDTTAMNPTLTLPMGRPYALTATFVPMASLVSQFLQGGAALTPLQITALDRNGNNNNALDIGDLVAWLDQSGVQLSAALMSRILARMVP
jgi:M6 family metalloprotease-like protein